MKTPQIKFRFNSRFDFEVAWNFYNNQEYGGVNFWKRGALQYHDKLNTFEKNKNKKTFLLNYIIEFYRQHKNEFKYQKEEIKKVYKDKEKEFFYEAEKIFKNHSWPKGKYVAYLSIFDFCPRFLNDKTFFIFIHDNNKNILFTIFHEMLHFIFYDYCLTKYPKIFKSQNTENGCFWEIAELFNAVIQQAPIFEKLHGSIGNIEYPELRSKFKKAQKAWNGNIDDWITTFGIDYKN